MPLINVVRGERIPTAFTTVRTPVVRIPWWMAIVWWTGKGLAQLLAFVVRHWPVTLPAVLLAWAWSSLDWQILALVLIAVAAGAAAWWRAHPVSFRQYLARPVVGRWRRLWTYRRDWPAAMATCGLATVYNGQRYVPALARVRTNGWADFVTVRLLPGQTPEDYGKAADRLAYTFRVLATRVRAERRADRLELVMLRRDPLAAVVEPFPVPEVPDLTALALGVAEDGSAYSLRLTGAHILVVGATGAGKGSVVWLLIAALAGGVRSGVVRLWVFDPKAGMELAAGTPMFDRFFYKDPASMADAFEDAVRLMQARADRLRGVTRQHTATVDDPTYVLIVDELAALTAYVMDRKVRDRIREALSLLLSQGRAVGVHVVAALQDPRKDILPFRDLFPTRIALRLTEASQVDLVLGDGARDRGALCDRVSRTTPGVAYVVNDGDADVWRVRFSYYTDDAITELVAGYPAAAGRGGESR